MTSVEWWHQQSTLTDQFWRQLSGDINRVRSLMSFNVIWVVTSTEYVNWSVLTSTEWWHQQSTLTDEFDVNWVVTSTKYVNWWVLTSIEWWHQQSTLLMSFANDIHLIVIFSLIFSHYLFTLFFHILFNLAFVFQNLSGYLFGHKHIGWASLPRSTRQLLTIFSYANV